MILSIMQATLSKEAQTILQFSEQELRKLVIDQKLDPDIAQKILEKIGSRLQRGVEKEEITPLDKLVESFKERSDPRTRALGYDLEIALITQKIIVSERYLKTIPSENTEDRERIEKEISLLEQQKQKLQQERREIKTKNQDGNEVEIPNQVEALAQQVLRAVKKINAQEGEAPPELTEEEIKAIQENPLTALTSAFAQGLESAIIIEQKESEKGEKTEGEILVKADIEKFNKFLTALVEERVIEESDKQSMVDYFQKAAEAMEGDLTQEEKKLIFKEKSERVVVGTGLGLIGIFLLLAYLGYKSEMGEKRGFMG
ncbi:MAG: hypothetical protein QXD54_05415 [Candidatus Aenigmatarchaeota archaeon]